MNTTKSSYIDLGPLKEEVEGNMIICKTLIKSFITDIDEYVALMNAELKISNLPTLYQVAHKIIPSIRIFNIMKLEPIIIELETYLREEDDLERIRNHIDSSLVIFYQVKTELHNELNLIDDAAV